MGTFFRALTTGGTTGTINGSVELSENGFRLVTKKGYRGVSAEIDVVRYLCAVCHQDHEECPHTNVDLLPQGIAFRSPSLVRNPKLGTYLTDILVIKTNGKRRYYRWIGFRENAQIREERIMGRLESGDLSETAAAVILDHFSSRKSGECRFAERV
jgi:hypothetical protein